MKHFNFFLFLSTIGINHFINYALALQPEEIRSGMLIKTEKFTYQVAILVKSNGTNEHNLIGSGSIIAANLILSAAQCFIEKNGLLQKYHYSITTNTTNWKDIKGIEALIDLIYVPSGAINYVDDIAVSKLDRSLDIANNQHLSALNIPSPDESFLEQSGLVTGYGFCWVVELITIEDQYEFRRRLSAKSDNNLRFENVLVTNKTNCSIGYRDINTDKQFCGVMDRKYLLGSGICDNDSGSPLVIDNKVVGVAGSNHFDCDDTNVGSAYAKVSHYAPFINSIMSGNPLPDVLILQNRNHTNNYAAYAIVAAAA